MLRMIPARVRCVLCLVVLASGCRAELDTRVDSLPTSRVAVETSARGWTRVETAALIDAGLPGDTPLEALALTRQGLPVAYRSSAPAATVADAGALSFWAEPADSRWTDIAVYWFETGPNATATHIVHFPPSDEPPATQPLRFRARTAIEKTYVLSLRNGPASNFVWDGAVATTGPASKAFAIEARRPRAEGTFTLELELHGLTSYGDVDPDHHARFELGGAVIGDVMFDGLGDQRVTVSGPASLLADGANTLTLRLPHDTGAARDTVLVRAMTLDHPRASWDGDGQALAHATAVGAYTVDGLTHDSLAIDVTNPRLPGLLPLAPSVAFAPVPDDDDDGDDDSGSITPPPLSFVAHPPAGGPARIAIVPPGTELAPRAVRASRHPRRAPLTPTELLVIAPEVLAPAAERLVEHRRDGGVAAELLLWDEVVDGWGEGVPSPDAIASLVRELGSMHRAPRWLLLFGDGSHDPKDKLIPPEGNETPSGNLLPSPFDDSALMETHADNALVAPGPRERPSIAVGRIPAATLDEAEAVVDKILAYEAAPPVQGGKVLLTADDAPTAWEWQLFEQTSEALASILPADLPVERLYVGTLGATATHDRLLEELQGTPLWVNYLGHGNYTEWAAERIFQDDDLALLPEADVLPLYTVMNCLTGHFTQPNWKLRSLGELLLVTPRKGAIAVIASGALSYPGGQAELDLALAERLLVNTDAPTIGEALLEAKAQLDPADPEQSDVILSWHLLGDPSMRLKRP